MSFTTDLTGGLFGTTKEEVLGQAKVAATQAHANALVEAAKIKERGDPWGPSARKLGRPGTLGGGTTGGGGAGGADLKALAAQVQGGAELGGPTSFAGGAGAPEPVAITRGMQTRFAGGPNLTEFATPLQARQDFNRAQGEGKFVPVGGELENLRHANKLTEISATGKSQEVAGGQVLQRQQQAHKYLGEMLLQQYGVSDPADKTGQTKTLPDYARAAMLSILPKVKDMEGVAKILEEIAPKLEQGKQLDTFNNPATRAQSRAAMLASYRADQRAMGLAPDPKTEAYIGTAEVTAQNLPTFQAWKARGGPVAPGTPPGAPPVSQAPVAPEQYQLLSPSEVADLRKLRRETEAAETPMWGEYSPSAVGVTPRTKEDMTAAWERNQAAREAAERQEDLRFLNRLQQDRLQQGRSGQD